MFQIANCSYALFEETFKEYETIIIHYYVYIHVTYVLVHFCTHMTYNHLLFADTWGSANLEPYNTQWEIFTGSSPN